MVNADQQVLMLVHQVVQEELQDQLQELQLIS
jgi:hypothetical protein